MKAWSKWECKNCQETKTSGQSIDSNYIEKMPGSDRSSKLSDGSDSISINRTLDRRRDKSSVKSGDSDEKVSKKNSKSNDADDSPFVPIYRDSSKWDYSRKLVSPERRTVYDWKQSDDVQNKGKQKEKKRRSTRRQEAKCDTTDDTMKNGNAQDSVFMPNYDLNKLYNNDIFQRHPFYKEDNNIDTSIPDAQVWSFGEVFDYFAMYFPEQAHVFKEQVCYIYFESN